MAQAPPHPSAFQAWLIWLLGAGFYLMGFYQRVAPAVFTDRLMADFGIGAAALGNLSAFYFYSYVFMQVPTGILADSWGPRRLLTAGALVAGVGTLLFGLAPSFLLATLGRLLIGASVGVAWVSLLKISTHWFPPRRFAVLSGLALLSGILGAVSAGVPLRFLVEAFGWRPVMVATALLTLCLALCIWLLVRDTPEEKGFGGYLVNRGAAGPIGLKEATRGVLRVFRYWNIWFLTFAPSGVVGPVLAFSGLWGVPFFTSQYGMSASEAAGMTSTLLVAWAAGGPLMGGLSDRLKRRKPLYVGGAALSWVGWMLLLYIPGLPVGVALVLLVAIGFGAGGMIIGFAFAKESVPPSLAGTVSGVCNMGVMAGPMVLQPAIGWVLDHCWDGTLVQGVRVYGAEAYRAGFLLIVIWSLLAVALLAMTRETRCEQQVLEG